MSKQELMGVKKKGDWKTTKDAAVEQSLVQNKHGVQTKK